MEEDKKEEKILEERKEKIVSFFKVKYNWIAYIVLAILVWFAVWLRTLPMKIRPETGHPGLWDITTNNWTLGPDLDPFLFLRWAKDIILHGSLMANDTLRYVPLGFNVRAELTPLVYMIAWFHKFAAAIGLSSSVEQSAVIFPVFMFALTVIAFFLLSRKIFIEQLGEVKANVISIIASFFLIVIPSLLPRTIAGIPEKESAAFLFFFLTFYFFICAWRGKSRISQISFALLAGLMTAMMAGVWGGFIFVFVTLGLALFMAFILGQFNKNRLIASIVWIISSMVIMNLLSTRYYILGLFNSTAILIPFVTIVIASIDMLIFETSIKRYFDKPILSKLPRQINSIIIIGVVGLIVVILAMIVGVLPFSLINDKFSDITKPLIAPITDRLGVTVAENRQPYFSEWANSFGPILGGKLPLFFWLFFIGSVYLYSRLMNVLPKKERIVTTISYVIFLIAIIFSRYSPNSTFNGTNFASLGFYIIGVLCLVGAFGYYYYRHFKTNNLDIFKSIDFGFILFFSLFFFSIISARGAVRTIMLLVPPTSMMVAYFVVDSTSRLYKVRDKDTKIFAFLIIALLALSTIYAGYTFYRESKATSYNYVPNVYTQQWQLAMSWVRENTPTNAVFGHWWDYGYWVQTMGERATVLDGGNAIVYWDHFMGRYGLTAPSSAESLQFLYAHNTTHFLIDSTDIGKYSAFSSIGSDENYDRASFITTLYMNKQQIQENKNSTIYLYQLPNSGAIPLDEDTTYEINGTKIFLPGGKALLGAILIERNKSGKIITNPIGIYVYQNQQYRIPIRYSYSSDNFTDFGSGIESGVYLFPAVIPAGSGITVEKDYALLYLSKRTVKSQVARLYLYKDDDPYFKLVHSEDDFVVRNLKDQNAISESDDIVDYQGLRGPIRIWEIHYPSNISLNQSYLVTTPNKALLYAK